MTDKIQPALTPEEWADQHYVSDDLAITRHRSGVGGNRRLQITVRTSPIDSDSDLAALVALANAALPDSDPRKIARAMVNDIREAAHLAKDALKVYGPRETWGNVPLTLDALIGRAAAHAAALESYLPPQEPTPRARYTL